MMSVCHTQVVTVTDRDWCFVKMMHSIRILFPHWNFSREVITSGDWSYWGCFSIPSMCLLPPFFRIAWVLPYHVIMRKALSNPSTATCYKEAQMHQHPPCLCGSVLGLRPYHFATMLIPHREWNWPFNPCTGQGLMMGWYSPSDGIQPSAKTTRRCLVPAEINSHLWPTWLLTESEAL